MKTALLISGRINRTREDFPSVSEKIIQPLNADVFIETWLPKSFIPKSVMSLDEVDDLYRPVAMRAERYENSEFMWSVRARLVEDATAYRNYNGRMTGNNRESVNAMYYKIMRSFELMESHEKHMCIQYDMVIRSRFELAFQSIEFPPTLNSNTVYIPEGGDFEGGISDLFAFGDRDSMGKYCSLYSHWNDYKEKGYGLHPESILRKHLEVMELNVIRIEARISLRGNPFLPVATVLQAARRT